MTRKTAPAPSQDVITILVNSNTALPAVRVTIPDPMPQIVEVTASHIANNITTNTVAPQAILILRDASYEIQSNNVVTDVIKSGPNKSDIVVATPIEDSQALTAAGIDPMQAIKQAISETAPMLPGLPPATVDESKLVEVEVQPHDARAVAVVVPEVLSSVVEATVDAGRILLKDTSEHIPPNADLIPVVTPAGQPNIIVAVTPSTQAVFDHLGLDVAKDLSKAISDADSAVAPTQTTFPPVFPSKSIFVIVNGEAHTVPTVKVNLPDPIPQIVKVGVTDIATFIDRTSEHPQLTLNVTEAVHEVPDDVVTDIIKTEVGESDIIVATPQIVHSALEANGINVGQTISDAIAQAALTGPFPPLVPSTPRVSIPDLTHKGIVVAIIVHEVVSQVLEATVEIDPVDPDKKDVVLSDVSTNVPITAKVYPVVTSSATHDIMVAIQPQTQVALNELGVVVPQDISAALKLAQTDVVTADPVQLAAA